MRPFLTFALPFHWMVVFLLLAMSAASGGDGQLAAFDLLRLAAPAGIAGSAFDEFASAVLATGFGVVAALFLWLLFAAGLGETEYPGPVDELSGLAFGGAALTMTALILAAAVGAVEVVSPAIAFYIAALCASYAAVQSERRALALHVVVESDDVRAAARFMAAGAAHTSMLPRLIGRDTDRGAS